MNILFVVGPIIVIGLGLFYYFRTPAGEHLIDVVRPKPSLTDPNNWLIGPISNEGNQSRNMPVHPAACADGWVIDMPTPQSEPHYVTVDHGPLTSANHITLKGHIEIEDGGQFFAKDSVSQASMCLYFQRQFDDWEATQGVNDNWVSNQNTQYYRWYATNNAMLPIMSGPFELTAQFADRWTALRGDSEDSLNPHEGAKYFKQAIDNAGEVGFVFGGGDGWGHGIIATKPAKIIITSVEIG